jgi:hypothetical protein
VRNLFTCPNVSFGLARAYGHCGFEIERALFKSVQSIPTPRQR